MSYPRPGSCFTCRWWAPHSSPRLPADMAACRAAPPYGMAADPHPEVEWLSLPRPLWPITRSSDWCGRHERSPAAAADEAARQVEVQIARGRAAAATQ